ncbi:hypothetical protein [Sphingomonas sp. GM_Shp_2]|uniref:hypothetical protein n=1 Tax=Sphingomonas sp. GM_Shp_2 TaxID=2937380 RepID=UPI0022699280|nr:hypothetical protein [Sphingomonas sp. GM_Shp_2]
MADYADDVPKSVDCQSLFYFPIFPKGRSEIELRGGSYVQEYLGAATAIWPAIYDLLECRAGEHHSDWEWRPESTGRNKHRTMKIDARA